MFVQSLCAEGPCLTKEGGYPMVCCMGDPVDMLVPAVTRKRWYFAHRVGSAEPGGQDQNVRDTKAFCRAILDEDPPWTLCVPWLLRAELTADDHPSSRARALDEALSALVTCDGLLLAGPVLSPGMRTELRMAVLSGIPIVNMVGLSVEQVAAMVRLHAAAPEAGPLKLNWGTRVAYEAWISNWRSRNVSHGFCLRACKEMQTAFPELEIVPGFVELNSSEVREHFWCLDAFHGIVDPTSDQFSSGIYDYRHFVSGDPVRVGTCLSCGAAIMQRPSTLSDVVSVPVTCSEACSVELARAFSNPIPIKVTP